MEKTRDNTSPGVRRSPWLGPLVMAVLCLGLYAPGLGWGLPGLVSWSQDTIAGTRTLGAVAGWPEDWQGRYPPLHYLLLRAAYAPLLTAWEASGEVTLDRQAGRVAFAEPVVDKLTAMYLTARLLSLLMAIAAVLGIYAAALQLTANPPTAGLAAAVLMIGPAFAYFARLGNVDIPSLCWVAWSIYFFARLLQTFRWTDALLLGLFGSLAISTKDSAAGLYPGMAVALLIARYSHDRATRSPLAAAWTALRRPQWLVGLAAFALPYLLINGAFHNPDAYLERMRYWLDPAEGSRHAAQHRYSGGFGLLAGTIYYAAGAVGWPMLSAMMLASVHLVRRHRRLAIALLLPVLSYYLAVIVPIGFVYSRFLLPPLALLGMVLAVAIADFVRWPRLPEHLRLTLPLLVILPSLGYCIALAAEMVTDSRYAAEHWFREHVPPGAPVGAFALGDQPVLRPQYLPRVHEMGYATYPVVMADDWLRRPQPDYLILTSYNYEDFDPEQQACMARLLSGGYGYHVAARFGPRFLGTGSHWLSLAGWGAPPPGKISPTLIVLRRTEAGF